jgi:hypothetical protein
LKPVPTEASWVPELEIILEYEEATMDANSKAIAEIAIRLEA